DWLAATNALSFTVTYDASLASFSDVVPGSSGAYSTSVSSSESAGQGKAQVNASISNFGDASDFLQIEFEIKGRGGESFAYSLTNISLNGKAIGMVSDSVMLPENGEPTGDVVITGEAEQGKTLIATHSLVDKDGLGEIGYQWLADDKAIDGATSATLTLVQEHVSKAISVVASYTDGRGMVESKPSAATTPVA